MSSPGAADTTRGAGVTAPFALAGRTLPSRTVFGPHVTNLADPHRPRAFCAAHVEHYRARAAGGAGVVVTEVASVHPSDHPYEYAPSATEAAEGWTAIAAACRAHGTAVLAGLGHAGAQGSSAYHRAAVWAPSPVPDPTTGEVPVAMSAADVDALVAGFAAAAARAVAAGCDGVEIQAGQHALLRQYLSGLSNHRDDAEGADRARLLVEVLTAVRAAVPGALVGLRLAVDELAPWAGITPVTARGVLERVAGLVDLVVPARGSALSVGATRPDAHTAPGVLRPVVRELPGVVRVLDGVVDLEHADDVLGTGDAELVEMTRALLADAGLVAAARAGRRPRPCVLTNQRCLVRDTQNPRVGCTVEPAVGTSAEPLRRHPTTGSPRTRARDTPAVLVAGAGPAGLEAALTLAHAGVAVRLVERARRTGGLLRDIATLPGRARFADLADFYDAELAALGVTAELGVDAAPDEATIVAVGGLDRPTLGVPLAVAVRDGVAEGPVVISDPIGDGAAVALAERLAGAGREVAVVTPDVVVGPGLAATGDLVDAQARLARAGVRRLTESRVVDRDAVTVTVADVVTGATSTLPAAVLVDAAPRRAPSPPGAARRVGDALAPRTVAEAVREGRAAARELLA